MTRTIAKPTLRLGFFTRLLDQADAAERYRLATAQIVHADRCGFDSAWVAQHHFHEDEGGLPAPFVFLSQIAARTTRIRLGTGIVTPPLELPVRLVEDAVVLDLMCGGRLEVGIGPGGNLSAYEAFGLDSTERTALPFGAPYALRAQPVLLAQRDRRRDAADARRAQIDLLARDPRIALTAEPIVRLTHR